MSFLSRSLEIVSVGAAAAASYFAFQTVEIAYGVNVHARAIEACETVVMDLARTQATLKIMGTPPTGSASLGVFESSTVADRRFDNAELVGSLALLEVYSDAGTVADIQAITRLSYSVRAGLNAEDLAVLTKGMVSVMGDCALKLKEFPEGIV